MTDTRMHNDCEGIDCAACAWDEFTSKGARCETCIWWLRDDLLGGLQGICRRYRPSGLYAKAGLDCCDEHSFTLPISEEST